ncbi:MAG: hypothetical protein ACI9EF_000061 [Pseudohongiellaceae bacterium]|jgi:hypothetical protein
MKSPMKTAVSFALCAVVLGGCTGPRLAPISAARFEEHVSFLADDEQGGRGTGSTGLAASAEYVAAQFKQAGLSPAGDGGTWMQHFDAPGGRVLVAGNALELDGRSLVVGEDWTPFSSVTSCDVQGPLVFAGYGFSNDDGYDDYAGLDVKGKFVLVMRGAPGGEAMEFTAKINTAYKAGAAGILIVNDPAGYPEGSADDVPLAYARLDSAGSTSSLPAVHLTADALLSVLAGSSFDLRTRQTLIESLGKPASVALDGVELALTIASEREQLVTMNVVGVLPGSDPAAADEWVLVGAHMDHLGLGDRSSMGGPEAAGQIHNGADDNASGTAGLIEIAHVLAGRTEALPRTVVFAAFGAEEMGLLGSVWLNEHPPWPQDGLVAMVNMDMIGRADNGDVAVGGLGTGDTFSELFGDLVGALGEWAVIVGDDDDDDDGSGERRGLKLNTSPGLSSNSDHYTFVKSEVPSLSLFTGLHDDYHKPSDDVELIDAEGGALIATLAAEFILALSELDERPVFIDVDAGRPASVATVKPPEGSTVVRGGVRFGSRPDYTYANDDGVRIEGVSAESPAEKCGLMHGDVILAMDGTTIRNIQDYVVLLYSHRPGDTMVLTVRRGDGVVELLAVLEAGGGSRR